MKVVIEKKRLDAMYQVICEKTDKLSDLIEGYIPYDELKDYMCGLLNEIRSGMKETYNQELVELKLQLGYLQQKLQSNQDVNAEEDLYREYVQIEQRISEIENPF
jgi:hypothetical protein